MACCTWGQGGGEGSGWVVAGSVPRVLVRAPGLQSRVPSLAPVPLRVTATALGVPWVTEGHTHLKAALCKGKGVGDSCLKRENASFPVPPGLQTLFPCPTLGVHGPSAPGWSDPAPLRVWAGPPVGWALLPVRWEFLPAESQAAGGGSSSLSPELSLDLEKGDSAFG